MEENVSSCFRTALFRFLQKRKRREKDDDAVSLCSLDFKVTKTLCFTTLCNQLLCGVASTGNTVLSVFAFPDQHFRCVQLCLLLHTPLGWAEACFCYP